MANDPEIKFGDLKETHVVSGAGPERKALGNLLQGLGFNELAKKIAPQDLEITITHQEPPEVRILEDTGKTQDDLVGDITVVPLGSDMSVISVEHRDLLAVENTAIIRKMACLMRDKYSIITGHEPTAMAQTGEFNYIDLSRLAERWKLPIFLATTGNGDTVNQGHFVLPVSLPPIYDEGKDSWKIKVFNSLHGGVEDFLVKDWDPSQVNDTKSLTRALTKAHIFSFQTSNPVIERIASGNYSYDLTRFPEELSRLVGSKTTATQRGHGAIDCGLYCVAHGAILASIANPLGVSNPINNEQMRKDFARAVGQEENDPNSGIKIADINELYRLAGIDDGISIKD